MFVLNELKLSVLSKFFEYQYNEMKLISRLYFTQRVSLLMHESIFIMNFCVVENYEKLKIFVIYFVILSDLLIMYIHQSSGCRSQDFHGYS